MSNWDGLVVRRDCLFVLVKVLLLEVVIEGTPEKAEEETPSVVDVSEESAEEPPSLMPR